MTGETHQLLDDLKSLGHYRIVGIQPGFTDSLWHHLMFIPPAGVFCHPLHLFGIYAKCFADISNCTSRAIGNDRGCQGGSIPTVLTVYVLHDFFASLMFEIDIDIRRLITLARDEALKQKIHVCRVHFSDSKAITDS